MAPIFTSATGITPQVLDDPRLAQLLQDVKALSLVDRIETLQSLTELLEPHCSTGEWPYDESVRSMNSEATNVCFSLWLNLVAFFQVELFDWIHPLNVLDSALTWILKNYSHCLLLLPSFGHAKEYPAASSLAEVQQCPSFILSHTQVILQFSTLLLRNSTSKHLYNSVELVSDLMAAANDAVADAAVGTLTALSLPPAPHAFSGADAPILSTQLHQSGSKMDVQDRLLCTARAWGSRALGLGLFVTVTADDSLYGQGALPVELGEVHFSYTRSSTAVGKIPPNTSSLGEEITLTLSDMQLTDEGVSSPSPDHSVASSPLNEVDGDGDLTMVTGASKKRRKVTSLLNENLSTSNALKKRMRSTAELFFLAVEKAGSGRLENIPTDRWFSLLAEIRLARSFHSQADRCAAVNRRLLALTAVLNAHPFNEVMTGYFEAQPELCVDIVDLLRPLVSAASVSAVSTAHHRDTLRPDAVENLVSEVSHDGVPFALRMAAVEALTALVSRRENASNQISGYGRLASVLSDLGVGKGQYLGLLPTLIRYSLAALGSVIDNATCGNAGQEQELVASDAFKIGLAFVAATVPPPISRKLLAERALQFIGRVLTLTSAVVGSLQGVMALVDCGLIPTLLSTVSLHPEETLPGLLRYEDLPANSKELERFRAALRLITAQAVQILENVIVTHPSSMVTFHDLNGVEILIKRLSREIEDTKRVVKSNVAENDMDIDEEAEAPKKRSSQCVTIFSLLNCLTVVFQQDSSNSEISPLGGIQLRKKEFSDVLLEILNNVPSFGGQLVSLVSILLSDIMNGDPLVIPYVLSCGLADSFLRLVIGEREDVSNESDFCVPMIPPCPDLFVAIPNVISALGLTDDGAKLVADFNPFPCLLRLLYHPDYSMPRSRFLLNELPSSLGNGLDEIVRHVHILKPLVYSAIADAMNCVIIIAKDLLVREEKELSFAKPLLDPTSLIEHERSCLIQYILNFGQLLEPFLHNEENCEPFVDAGGLDSLLLMFRLAMPPPEQFLTFVSTMSSPSLSTHLHSTTEEALSGVFKYIEIRYDSLKLLRKLVVLADQLFVELDQIMSKLSTDNSINFLLDLLPPDPAFKLASSPEKHDLLLSTSHFLRTVSSIQWITNLIGNSLKAKSSESSWGRAEKEWKAEIASDDFCRLIDRLCVFYRASLFEVCRVRAESEFEEAERARHKTRSSKLRYRLRIVCTEGAVVRDGIEIDSCANVGSLEMGDIVESFDRCINSSGILRYRTSSGWISEMTRGHGREPIAEVIRLWECDGEVKSCEAERAEMGVLGLRSVAVSVLARSQASSAELFGALSKLVVQGVRTLPLPLTFDKDSAGACVASLTKLLVDNLKQSLRYGPVFELVFSTFSGHSNFERRISEGGAAMYLASVMNLLHACLFDDKRERRIVNVPLLLSLVVFDANVDGETVHVNRTTGAFLFFVAGFIFRHGLADFSRRYDEFFEKECGEQERLRTSRSVASSFPPVILLFRKLSTTPMTSSPVASILSRMKWKDISLLLGIGKVEFVHVGVPDCDDFFHPESFVADFMISMSSIIFSVWRDERFRYIPPYLVYPISGLVGDIMILLEDTSKKKSAKSVSSASDRMRLSELLRLRPSDGENENFEVSENSITRLIEMGFTAEHARHALESTRSNSLETAMEFALSNDPPSSIADENQSVERDDMTGVRDASRNGNDTDNNHDNELQNANIMNVEAEVSLDGNRNGITVDALAKIELKKWIVSIPDVVCSLLNHMPLSSQRLRQSPRESDQNIDAKRNDDIREPEILTVVLCSFLLEFLHKYPEKCTDTIFVMLSKLKESISKNSKTNEVASYFIEKEREAVFGALCHASVIMIRALPKCRVLVLKIGVLGPIVSCMSSAISTLHSEVVKSKKGTMPYWMTSTLLLLEVMAQPVVAFSDDDLLESESFVSTSQESELMQVKSQHRNHISDLLRIVEQWINASPGSKTDLHQNRENAPNVKDPPSKVTKEDGDSSLKISLFPKVPPYFPLIPTELSHECLRLCHEILFSCGEFCVSPSILHSMLMLLVRLLRSPSTSTRCLKAGVAEAIVSLPKESFFTGNSSLITIIFRRLLEDEAALLSAMEAEIRSTVIKLHSKGNLSRDGPPCTSLMSFM